ncbi:MAG: phosphatidate cytidylyltransferase [Gammaproteobacteria bacterium]|nr:phosphatidate cytidylyltransferase [Gammaproteobacteria bacterium]
MLRTRLLTAAVLAPLAIAAVLLLPLVPFAVLMGLVALAAAWEWAALAGLDSREGRAGGVALTAASLVMLWLFPGVWDAALLVVVAFWVGVAGMVLTWPRALETVRLAPFSLAMSVPALAGAWLAMVLLKAQPDGGWIIVWTLALVAIADSGAYFAGRQFGRRRLAPRVSPGKTWEGLAGGALAGMVWSLAAALWLPEGAWLWLVAGIVGIIAAVFGDLFESALKRARGVKDSGALLPGHGGVLDRLDASLAALPVVALVVFAALEKPAG